MKKYVIAFVISLLLCFSLPVYASEYESIKGTAVVVTDTLNVRNGPSKDHQRMGTLKKDTMVQVIGIVEPDWYVIEYGGEEGYVHKDYVLLNQEEEVVEEDIEDSLEQEKQPINFMLIGIVTAIILVIAAMAVTLLRGKDNEEEEEEIQETKEKIPVANHEDTNMHLGEVFYDTYRLDIDPIYFEDTPSIPQPESIILEREAESGRQSDLDNTKELGGVSGDNLQVLDSKLEEATARIAELQKEVEELKKSKL